ncbi:MAG: colanic acid biosynthesis acetyltransferase WcaF, partial [Aureispira sp.]|nr:colanic acid biosynthesis acetyltransferase WcaF [Aureispira sp.]
TIGKGAVIGSRSSVYEDMPEGMICIGNPAKPVRPRMG